MTKSDLLSFLTANGKLFVQLFCVPFGVLAQECYQVLKNDNYRFRKVIPKLILAWFVCLIFGTVIGQVKSLTDLYPVLIMAFAFVYRNAADWLQKDFFQFILKYLNSKTPKGNE